MIKPGDIKISIGDKMNRHSESANKEKEPQKLGKAVSVPNSGALSKHINLNSDKRRVVDPIEELIDGRSEASLIST